MQSIALGSSSSVEVITGFTATNQTIDAVAAPPGWHVIGSFYMPSPTNVVLEMLGLVSAITNALTARLFCVDTALPVSGSITATIASMIDTRVVSGSFFLTGGRTYQMQAQVIGASGFGLIRSATIS